MIDSFRGAYRFPSNFYPVVVTFDGESYPTVEHAYQAAKTTSRHLRKRIADCSTPGDAKRFGRKLLLPDDWDSVKLSVMESLVRQKFTDAKLARLLVATSNQIIVEGNTRGDAFWGYCVVTKKGENHLGKILMQIRTELSKAGEQ